MTHADEYFAIGKAHTVCQDYVRCGTLPNGRAYVIVSDGCSSSKDTDIGSRILVLAAESYLRNNRIPLAPSAFDVIVTNARVICHQLGLNQTALDATLILAIETENQILVYKMGDGVIAYRYRDGTWGYECHEFTSGAPYYPNYLRDLPRHQAYMDNANAPVISTMGDGVAGYTKCSWTLEEYFHFTRAPIAYDKAEMDLIVLMTDGAGSFRKGIEPVEVPLVVQQIIDVKVPTGEFMVRRAKRFLGSYCTAQGWDHYDDFGVGGIFIDAQEVTP